MFISFHSLTSNTWPLLLLFVTLVKISLTKGTSSPSFSDDEDTSANRRADEYVMTSAAVDGIKRSNVCGDGYRIEGALLKSYRYSTRESYLPYEDCYMTFKARRSDQQIRVRILSLGLNDIHGGVNCLDSLRFYKSVYIARKDKLDTVECGQVVEGDGFHRVSSTGIVTAHFTTDGGNVSGLGFKVVLTAFRDPNKTHPCDHNNDEYLCNSRECISSWLVCDNVPHCLDGSDESPHRSCASRLAEPWPNTQAGATARSTVFPRTHWRGIVITAFLLIILIVFILFAVYFLFNRCLVPRPMPLINGERKNYATIVNSPINGPRSSGTTTTHVVSRNDKTTKRLDDDYNLL